MVDAGARPQARLTVEVVVCTYNGARFIEQQLSSILDQTHPAGRISVYDDGSTDGTVELMEMIAARSGGRLVVSRNGVNLGYARNFAQGLERATADIVFFSDQDDIWERNKIERLLSCFNDPHCALAFSDGRHIDAKGAFIAGLTVLRQRGLQSAQLQDFECLAWPLLLRDNFINGAAMAMRRTAALQALPVPEGFPHDYWLALWLAGHGSVAVVDETLFRYRLHQDNLIGARVPSLHHQLHSIWKSPAPPRQRDLARTRVLLERWPDNSRRMDIQQKLQWLMAVANPGNSLVLTWQVLKSAMNGRYRQYGTPYALLRDLVAAWRHTR